MRHNYSSLRGFLTRLLHGNRPLRVTDFPASCPSHLIPLVVHGSSCLCPTRGRQPRHHSVAQHLGAPPATRQTSPSSSRERGDHSARITRMSPPPAPGRPAKLVLISFYSMPQELRDLAIRFNGFFARHRAQSACLRGGVRGRVLRTECLCPPSNSYVGALTPSMAVFAGGASQNVINVKGDRRAKP